MFCLFALLKKKINKYIAKNIILLANPCLFSIYSVKNNELENLKKILNENAFWAEFIVELQKSAAFYKNANIFNFLNSRTKFTAEENIVNLAEQGFTELINFLVEQKTSINYGNHRAIRVAAKNGHFETIKFLVSQKGDVKAENSACVPLSVKFFDILKFLIANGAEHNTFDNKAFHCAAILNQLNSLEFLYSLGVSNLDESLCAAALAESEETALFLINKGAKINGDFALSWSAGSGKKKSVEILLNAGANPRNLTALKLAAKNNFVKIFEMLLPYFNEFEDDNYSPEIKEILKTHGF